MYRAKNWEDALSKAERLIADGGYGHTSSLFIDTRETEKMAEHAKRMKTCRIPSSTPRLPRAASATSTTSRCRRR